MVRPSIPKMMLAVVSDVVMTALYAALTGLIVATTNVFVYRLAALKVEAVRVDLKVNNATHTAKLDDIAATGEKTHTLVNGATEAHLKLVVELSRWKADHEPTPENKNALKLAEQKLAEHVEQQRVVSQGS